MIRKLRYHKRSYQLTLPKELVEYLGWKPGDNILFELDGESVRLKKISEEYGFRTGLDVLEEHETLKKRKIIYTIGYEGKTIEKLIEILRNNNISVLVDVRELPLSRKNGFSKKALKEHLTKAGIEYISLKELGSPKELRHSLRDKTIKIGEFKELYRKYLNEHPNALKRLEEIAMSKLTVIMCYEANWQVCHRSVIAEFLERDGFEVIHL